MVFHEDYEAALSPTPYGRFPIFKVGDLVSIKDDFLHGNPVGIVTEVRDLCHALTDERYTAVCVCIEGEVYTLPQDDFKLVKRLPRQ